MRLIDADYLVNVMIHNCPIEEGGIPVKDFATHNRILAFYPTIDAVPVVRCKDCIRGEIDDPDFPDHYYCHCGCGWNRKDFFCAYGERKDDAENH